MSVPTDKAELLKAIQMNFEKLIIDLKQIPLHMVDEKTLAGHAKDTTMSVANLTAYLVGWNELVLKWLDQDAAGQTIDFPETGYKWNELGRLAQKFYLDYENIAYPELLERLECAKSRIVSIIENYSNDVLYGQSWYEKWTMGRMIQFNTSSPYVNARIRVRKWLKTQSV